MKVKKLTEKYLFYQEGVDYILNLGSINKGEDTTTELLFEGVNSPQKTTIKPKCGCTVVDKVILDSNSFSIKIKYTQCETIFTKIIVINEGTQEAYKIKIKGGCR